MRDNASGREAAFHITTKTRKASCHANTRTDGTFLDTVLRARDAFGFSYLKDSCIFLTGLPEGRRPGGIATLREKLSEAGLNSFTPEPLDASQPGVIIFTSGTTGAPKGIEVTWQKLMTPCLRNKSSATPATWILCMPVNHSNSLYLNIMPANAERASILNRRRFT